MNRQRDDSHLVSMIMPVVFDKETWMKFQSGRERLAGGSKNVVLYEYRMGRENDRYVHTYNPLANKATCWPRTPDPSYILRNKRCMTF